MVTYTTVCTRHIKYNNDEVIIVEVTMIRQKISTIAKSGNLSKWGCLVTFLRISDY